MGKFSTKRARNKFMQDIYFSPKRRAWNKKHFLKLERAAIDMWERMDELTPKERWWAGEIAHLASLGLKRIEEAEAEIEAARITDLTFRLYKHPKKPSVIIITSFYKPSEKRYKNNSWHIPAGLPTPRHPVRIAHVKREAIPTDGYVLKDEGKFRELYKTFGKATEIYKGKKTYKIYAKVRSKGNEGDILISYKPFR